MNRSEIQKIKEQAGIKPFEQRLKALDLQQVGGDYLARCPWHEATGNHSPSLAIFKSKDDGLWAFKCRSGAKCEKHKGDVIAFVQQMDQVTFAEALRNITNEVGLAEPVEPAAAIQTPTEEQFKEANQYLVDGGVSMEIAKARNLSAIIHPKLGLAIAMPYLGTEIIKYRCVGKPKDKNSKFSHASGHPSDDQLYNINATDKELDTAFGSGVYVVESERDCLMMNSLGYMAVSVSSATSCIDSDGKLKIDEDQLKMLARADEIFLALDQDPAGQACADAFEIDTAFNSNQIKRILWPYRGKRSADPKDIGDLYKKDPAAFQDSLQALSAEARNRPPKWRQQFRKIGEMDGTPVKQLITGFLTEGWIGLGGLSGSGKTFLGLSITKALVTGEPFLGHFTVPQIVPVIYLIPEVGDRQFMKRAKAFGLPDDEELLLVRTLSMGVTLPLDHPWLASAIRNMSSPVVVLDTAIRFSKAKEENSARENLWMEQAMRALREAGCQAVIALHHSPKANSKAQNFHPSLENTFRGTGDIGALLDIGYNIYRDHRADGEQAIVTCVKPRDFDPPKPFRVGFRYECDGGLRSFINEGSDLRWMGEVVEEPEVIRRAEGRPQVDIEGDDKVAAFVKEVMADPKISVNKLRAKVRINKNSIHEFAKNAGYALVNGVWTPLSESEAEETVQTELDISS